LSESILVIRTEDPEDDQLLKSLADQLDEAGISAQGKEEPLKGPSGKAQAPVFLLLLAAPAIVKLAEKMGDAIVEWVKNKKPDTSIVLELGDRKITVHSNQVLKGQVSDVTARITAMIRNTPYNEPPALMGGGHGGG
jgi:hypothetical protein